jgi:hypothetical protein
VGCSVFLAAAYDIALGAAKIQQGQVHRERNLSEPRATAIGSARRRAHARDISNEE